MDMIFMRHGEATDNVKELISDREIYWSTLTEKGKETVKDSIKNLPVEIDKIYVSPFPRTIETAHFVYEKNPKSEVIIEKRLHEIYYGKYSGQKNNEELDQIRLKQIDGNFFARFGDYGENKYDIEYRLCEFLNDVYKNNFNNNKIMIVSHGSITSYMKRILNIKSPHIKTGKIEEFINVDFSPLFKHIKMLKKIKEAKIKERTEQIKTLNINDNLKNNLIKISKQKFNNVEFPDDYFSSYIDGVSTKKLIQENKTKFEDGIILICIYNNFENFAEKWINHYINIGIKNFVLVDNNSVDSSTKILKNYNKKVNISFWKINEDYNYYKMCGIKQQILEFYGVGHKYLFASSDELLIYENYKNVSFEDFIITNKLSVIKSLTLDVYNNKNIFEGKLEDYNYVDKGTYKISSSNPYNQKFYGGPIFRVFGKTCNLQKIPFITYTGNEVYVNDSYYYPWNTNHKAKLCLYILKYKYLKENNEEKILSNKKISFYDKNISILIDEIDFSNI